MKSVFITFLVFIVLSATALGIEVKPVNFSSPSPGGVFSFDFVVTPTSQTITAQFAQLTLDSVSPAGLTFDISASQAVENNPSFWVFGNSIGATAQSHTDGSYSFDDGANNPPTAIINDKILARFAFTWNGTPGDYIFALDRNINNSCVYLADFSSVDITLPSGQWYTSPIIGATDSSFTVHLVPEPASMLLFGLGGLTALRKLRQ